MTAKPDYFLTIPSLEMSEPPGQRTRKSLYRDFPLWAVQDSNLRPPACKAGALPAELTARAPHFIRSGCAPDPPDDRLRYSGSRDIAVVKGAHE